MNNLNGGNIPFFRSARICGNYEMSCFYAHWKWLNVNWMFSDSLLSVARQLFIVVVHKHKSLQVKPWEHMLHCHQISKGNISLAVKNMEPFQERKSFKGPPQGLPRILRYGDWNCEEFLKRLIHSQAIWWTLDISGGHMKRWVKMHHLIVHINQIVSHSCNLIVKP